MKPTEKYDVREFVPLDVFKQFGQAAWQFVSDNIVKLHTFTDTFFNEYFKAKDPTIERVVIVCNDYHNKMLLGTFSNRGLRTVAYINSQLAKKIKTAMLSQHVGGSTNAEDINVLIFYKNGKTKLVPSDEVFDIINANSKVFMQAGLTTMENKTMTKGWTHLDCRFTGLDTLYIVNP